jgi:hypothetical protein
MARTLVAAVFAARGALTARGFTAVCRFASITIVFTRNALVTGLGTHLGLSLQGVFWAAHLAGGFGVVGQVGLVGRIASTSTSACTIASAASTFLTGCATFWVGLVGAIGSLGALATLIAVAALTAFTTFWAITVAGGALAAALFAAFAAFCTVTTTAAASTATTTCVASAFTAFALVVFFVCRFFAVSCRRFGFVAAKQAFDPREETFFSRCFVFGNSFVWAALGLGGCFGFCNRRWQVRQDAFDNRRLFIGGLL